MKTCDNCKHDDYEEEENTPFICLICEMKDMWEPKDEQTRILEDWKEVFSHE